LLITFGVKKVLPAMKKLAAVKYVNWLCERQFCAS
jgi:hypothetical protein